MMPAQGERGSAVLREFNVLALYKGNERYVFVYDDEAHEPLIDALRDQAADPNLNFTWFDAAILTEKAREQAQMAEQGAEDGNRSVEQEAQSEERGTRGQAFGIPGQPKENPDNNRRFRC
jgi:hypothetical protein